MLEYVKETRQAVRKTFKDLESKKSYLEKKNNLIFLHHFYGHLPIENAWNIAFIGVFPEVFMWISIFWKPFAI